MFFLVGSLHRERRRLYNDWLKTFTHIEVIHLDGDTAKDEPSLLGDTFVCLSVCLFVSLSIFFCPSVRLFVCLYLCLSVCLSVCPSSCFFSVCLNVIFCAFLSIFLSVSLFKCFLSNPSFFNLWTYLLTTKLNKIF